MNQHGLTKRQHETLTFIKEYIAKNGYSPSYEEISEGVGLGGKAGVHRVIYGLVDRGRVTVIKDRARSIALVDGNG